MCVSPFSGRMQYQFSDCLLDIDAHTLTRDGNVVEIEPQVFDLLHLLVRNAGALVTRDQMIEEIWQGRIVSESAISARIAAVRRAVGDDGKSQSIVRTVARRGVKFVAELQEDRTVVSAGSDGADRQIIKFTTADDGVSLAYATSGSGPAILRIPHFPTHLELEWQDETEPPFFHALGAAHTLVRFDQRGCGMSELEIDEVDFSDERSAEDLKTVADAVGLDRFPVLGTSSGARVAVSFAAKYPERVSRLILLGGYVDGRSRRGGEGGAKGPDTINSMVREGWDTPDSAFVKAYISIYFPTATTEQLRAISRVVQDSCPMENALRGREAGNTTSIAHMLDQVRAPTLVMHCRGDAVHPLSEAQKMARGIEGAELLVLESLNHYPLPGEPSWQVHIDAMMEFLGRT
jgi:pimeloyl-ACP methyl ester carboxylesterase/DNA-binding winged helix-turn-helix (wHTH) protein